jgi:2-polyprenyl-3-methyl-5-hydroxy-6-metoxy-1,4-benzoquinol methylase/glycosyltransferase involved in cell wall biosynthesis
MDILIHSLGLPFNRDTLKTKGLGGSESAAYYQAIELGKRGHRVKIFTTHADSEADFIDGVQFISAGECNQQTPLGYRFEHYARNTPHDVLIIQRMPAAFHGQFASKVCIHQHHDLALSRFAAQILAGAWQVAAFTAVSEWHKKQMLEVYGLNPDAVAVVPNGVDADLYAGSESWDDPFTAGTEEFRLIYQSRPERGLEHLVRPGGIMDRARDLPVRLYIYGYENTVPHMAAFYGQLRDWAKALPNVTWEGEKSKAELAKIQTFADLLIYPTAFEEVSCISAMEAMHAGLPMLASRAGALGETCKDAGVEFINLKDGQVNEDAFVVKLREYFAGGVASGRLQMLEKKQRESAKTRTWAVAVDRLEAVIDRGFHSSLGGILRAAIERSDIRFAQWVLAERVRDPGASSVEDPIVTKAAEEIAHHFAFLDSDEAYAAHYAKHQAVYYDRFEEKVIGEDVTHTTRWRGVAMLVQQVVDANKSGGADIYATHMLDYGCAHGHYSMPLAKQFPTLHVHGMDVSPRAVEAFKKWATKEDEISYKVKASVGIDPREPLVDKINPWPEKYDIILAGEVLEHVRDPYALLEQFREALAPGGTLIITTPVGRWEHTGTIEFRNAREHVEHFDRADIEEIFAGHDIKIYSAPAGGDKAGFPCGSYVYSVKFKDGAPIGRPDFARKLATYGARQTISACLIVKNGAETVSQALDSVVDHVDQIIVAVDPATSDATLDVLAAYAAKFPFKSIEFWKASASATVDGFDAARNESIAEATGDWILWFDADEIVRRPWNLHKLARPSMHNGYGFKQIHYSSEPPQVLSTDMPCRFFRNHRGTKFFGVVHEHPEDAIGKAVAFSIVRPEIEFLHNGYVDEETRRERFRRNYPLVLRDMDEHPDRKLNQFLMLRDLAQAIHFEREQMGGQIAEHHMAQAQKAVDMFEKMVSERGGYVGNRMLIDALPYYSACVEVLGIGFTASFKLQYQHPAAPDLGAMAEASARFHSADFHAKFITSLIQEATAKYGSKYI